MQLFQVLNNEALDEDKKIQREVIERLKKQVALFNQPYKQPVELNDTTLNNIQRFIINFDDTLNKTLNDVYKKGELKEDTGDLVLNYNLLANYLDKIDFNLANVNDKRDVMDILDELTPKIAKVLSIIKLKDYTDVDLVEKVLNNFKNHTYYVILEKERNQIEKEKESVKPQELEISQLSPKEQKIKRLEDIIMKTQKIADAKQLNRNSLIYKTYNEANTFLKAVREGNEDLGRLNKFLRDREEKVNREYDSIFKSKVAEEVAEAQEEETQPEEPEQALAITPSLQQGAEEAQMPELEIQQPQGKVMRQTKEEREAEKKEQSDEDTRQYNKLLKKYGLEPLEEYEDDDSPSEIRRKAQDNAEKRAKVMVLKGEAEEAEEKKGKGKMKKRVYKKKK